MKHNLMYTITALLVPFMVSANEAINQDPGTLEIFDFMYEPAVKNGHEVDGNDRIAKSTMALMVVSSEGVAICSGTLIASDIVLTAAHCVPKDSSSIEVYGSYAGKNMSAYIDPEDVLVHPQFQNQSILGGLGGSKSYNDIALIRLRERVREPWIAAKLPGREVRYQAKNAVVAGWGRTEVKVRDNGTLRAGSTQVTSKPGTSIQLRQGGLDSAAACPGDSGGPIYITSGKNLVVIGVHSWGHCSYNIAYSESVGQHLKWIVNGMAKLRGDQEL